MLQMKRSLIKQSDLNSSPAKSSPSTNEHPLVNSFWISLERGLTILMKLVAAAKICLNMEVESLSCPLNQRQPFLSSLLGTHKSLLNEEKKALVSPQISICITPNGLESWLEELYFYWIDWSFCHVYFINVFVCTNLAGIRICLYLQIASPYRLAIYGTIRKHIWSNLRLL